MSTEKERTIFIVVDPAQDKPLALNRALNTANLNAGQIPGISPPRLHIFMAVDCDNTDTSAGNPAMHRDSNWLFQNVITPLQSSGLEYSLEMSWSDDWYGSIIAAAEKIDPELLMLPLVSRPSDHERIFNESIWRLLRTAKCPVLVVQPNSPEQRKIILAAVHFQSHKPSYQRLNELIITRGRWLVERSGAELHIVNAYKDSLSYPDRAKLANETKVDTANIHVRAGEPEEVIAAVAKELGADLVMLGTRNRSRRWRGNTAEKIITKVSSDILTIN
ncbi:universal stress protein [Oceanicoccus sp. KOV_DT_Chl]|uniref:universal stress protein n=1 Tax=Oceanicoccus sp. KOV_DT_Chl TaxID=1904639 RepID=UPI000C7DEF2D|nr:universal stress protein [Oceanicoccus sp. KOV_DT_Chl]